MSLDWVAEGIAVGALGDAADTSRLQEAGIEAVLQLYGHPKERCEIPLPLELLQLPVRDREPLDPRMLRQGVDFIRAQRSAGRLVLVCCGAGLSRSPAFVAAYLHEEGTDLDEAFAWIAARRDIRPHRVLIRSLLEIYDLCPSEVDVAAAVRRGRRAR